MTASDDAIGERLLIGLIGANIMKSLAPALHEDACRALGMTGHYHLMDVDRLPGRTLPQLLGAVVAAGFAGVNVTYPFKQTILPLLDDVAPGARQTGAVNTVIIDRESGRTTGHNTDRSGFRMAFEDGMGRDTANGRNVVLVGAGGAGSAAAFALMDLHVARLAVNDVDPRRAAALVAELQRHFGEARARVAGDPEAELAAADGIVNATPVGMLGLPGVSSVPLDLVETRHWVADVIYTPVETPLIRAATARDCRTLTGAGMAVHQAVDAFRLFTGREADARRMHRTFAAALAARDAKLQS